MKNKWMVLILVSSILLGVGCNSVKETDVRKKVSDETSDTSESSETLQTTTASGSSEPEEDPILPIEGDGTLWNTFRDEITGMHEEYPELEFALLAKDPDDADSFHALLVKNGDEVSEYALSSKGVFVLQKTYTYDEVSDFIAFHSYDEIMTLPVFPTRSMLTKEIRTKEEFSDGLYVGHIVGIKKDGSQVLVDISGHKQFPARDAEGCILSEYFDEKFTILDDVIDYTGHRHIIVDLLTDPETDPETGLVKAELYDPNGCWGIVINHKTTDPTNCYAVFDVPSWITICDFDINRADDTALDGYNGFKNSRDALKGSFFWYSVTHDVSGHVSDPRYSSTINSDDWYAITENGQEELIVIQDGYFCFIY